MNASNHNDARKETYCVKYAMAKSIDEPWVTPIPLVTPAPERGLYATGHHNIVNIPGTDEWIIAYHRFAFDASESSQTPESVMRDTQRGQLERGEMNMGALGRHRFAGFETNRQILGQSVAFHNIGFSYQAATNRFWQFSYHSAV